MAYFSYLCCDLRDLTVLYHVPPTAPSKVAITNKIEFGFGTSDRFRVKY